MGLRLASLIAVLWLGVIAPAASATEVSYSGDGSTLIVTGGDSAGHEIQFRLSADQQHDQIIDTVPFTVIPGDCTVVSANTWIECPGHAKVQVDLGSGNDLITFASQGFDCFAGYLLHLGDGTNQVNLSDNCPLAPGDMATVSAGSGQDSLSGGSQPVTFFAGPGDDSLSGSTVDDILHGGDGADVVAGNAGNDQVLGEGGNDVLRGAAGNDTEDGGEGDDDIGYSPGVNHDDDQGADDVRGGGGTDRLRLTAHTGGMTINLDDLANDGAPGENDNIHPDIERIDGTSGNDTFTGGPGPDAFDGDTGNDIVHGADGNDILYGGSDGDQVFGDAGADTVYGSNGDDRVDGGPGADSLFGDFATCSSFSCPAGNDQMFARDGEVDQINCGSGADTAQVDAADVAASDGFQVCESIDRAVAAAPGPAPGPGPGPGPAPAPTAGPFTFSTLGSLTRARGVRVRVTCLAPCTINATLVIGARTARKAGLGRRPVTIGTARRTRLTPGSTNVTVKLTRKARSRLRRLRTIPATLKLAVKDGAGTTTRRQRAVKLKR